MVNAKNVAFKVDKQTPTQGPPTQPFATVINCRKGSKKRAAARNEEVKSQQVPLKRIPGFPAVKRKRTGDDESAEGAASGLPKMARDDLSIAPNASRAAQRIKPTKLRRGVIVETYIDGDVWVNILRFMKPNQLFEMRNQLAYVFRICHKYPKIWEYSRKYHHGDDLPDPPAELTEFEYSDLRHGHSCMSCGTRSTRKTYWAFLRRWCKSCLQSRIIREPEAIALLQDQNAEDMADLQKCLPSAILDSWGNFVGVGPARSNSLKTVYLQSDVQKLVADFNQESQANHATWHAEKRTWFTERKNVVNSRREFARAMEIWEEIARASKSYDYQGKKDARKLYYLNKVRELTPPLRSHIALQIDLCPAFQRAVAIPKNPTMSSWLQLKPKLEQWAAEFEENGNNNPSPIPSTGLSTPSGTPTPIMDDSLGTREARPEEAEDLFPQGGDVHYADYLRRMERAEGAFLHGGVGPQERGESHGSDARPVDQREDPFPCGGDAGPVELERGWIHVPRVSDTSVERETVSP